MLGNISETGLCVNVIAALPWPDYKDVHRLHEREPLQSAETGDSFQKLLNKHRVM